MTTQKRLAIGLLILAVWLVAGFFLVQMTPRYPWKENVITDIGWIGENSNITRGRGIPDAWRPDLKVSYGGEDDPDPLKREKDFRPSGFVPKLNPFYFSLPYNDVEGPGRTKPEAREFVPWYDPHTHVNGKSILQNRWLAVRFADRVCYAQWTNAGPYDVDDWSYVFGNEDEPTGGGFGKAGLEVSPAVRDYLGLSLGDLCDWRFVEEEHVPEGPWRKYGANNPFVTP